ncbi:hypothetical protein V2J09_014956 [Rumex salicifolius]
MTVNKRFVLLWFFMTSAIEAVVNEHGSTTTLSCVSFTDDSGVLVGQAAKDQESVHPERTICGVNRLIGRRLLFFHLGGTVFITKILDLDMGMFEDIASKEDASFGGQTFDTRLVDYFVNLIKNEYGKDISNDLNALRKLRIECEKAKN